jgi:hypothetical protein
VAERQGWAEWIINRFMVVLRRSSVDSKYNPVAIFCSGIFLLQMMVVCPSSLRRHSCSGEILFSPCSVTGYWPLFENSSDIFSKDEIDYNVFTPLMDCRRCQPAAKNNKPLTFTEFLRAFASLREIYQLCHSSRQKIMSHAFVKEEDDQWLHDVAPTLQALTIYLTRENNGIRVYDKKNYTTKQGKQVYEMSNGLSYSKDDNGKWYVV